MAKEKGNVEYVAGLAKIKITAEEKSYLSRQISDIIGYIDKLKELNVEGVEPMRGLHIPGNVFRKDEVIVSFCREEILKNSPLREGDYFKIPKVIE
jgi:aspartyl-tRNA(Asn)/glutamyl-tRNA(Gln) amidotransferase subunit C